MMTNESHVHSINGGFILNNLQLVVVYLWVGPFIALLLNVLLFLALNKMKVLPATVLLQLKHLTVVVCFLSICSMFMYAAFLTNIIINGFSDWSRYRCAFWGFPENILGAVNVLSFTFFAFERWNATRNEIQASREGSTAFVKKGLVLVYAASATVGLTCAILQIPDKFGRHHFCGFLAMSIPETFLHFISAMILASTIGLGLLYPFVWFKNRRQLDQFSLTTTNYSVIERYQMRQTLKSFKLVAPSLAMDIFTVVVVIIHLNVIRHNEYNLENELELGLVYSIWRTISNLLHCPLHC